jgi:hypothetical protein
MSLSPYIGKYVWKCFGNVKRKKTHQQKSYHTARNKHIIILNIDPTYIGWKCFGNVKRILLLHFSLFGIKLRLAP